MAKLPYIDLSNGLRIPILHEDRNVIAIDKPQGWMLAPISWQNTGRNLYAALSSSVNAGDFWAQSRNLCFIRFVHRLDADTSGVLLLVKTPGAVPAYTEMFEERGVEKVYLAVVHGVPEVNEWRCELCIAPVPDRPGFMEVNNSLGKDAETLFRVIDKRKDRALVMCWPKTGRTHQIRVHLAAVGHPILGDELYGPVPTTEAEKVNFKLALRAIRLSFRDPFQAETVNIDADHLAFVQMHGFDPSVEGLREKTAPTKLSEHPKGRLERKSKVRTERPKPAPRRERSEERDFAEGPRSDWRQDEDSAGFAEEGAQRPPFRPRGPRQFQDRPREGQGFNRRPYGNGPRNAGGPRDFGGERPARRPFSPASGQDRPYDNRPPKFGRKPFGAPRSFDDDQSEFRSERPRNFGPRDDRSGPRRSNFGGPRSGGKPGYGRPYEDRGERRPYGGGRGYDSDRGPHGDQREARPGVFPSSAKTGLRTGFQKSFGGGPQGEGRPFRPQRPGNRPPGKFGGGKPAWGKKPAGRPFKKFSGPR